MKKNKASYPWSAYRRRTPPLEDGLHLKSAAEWLVRAQDANHDAGISYGYYFRGRGLNPIAYGWRQNYVETSGYCVETLFDLAKHYHDETYSDRAIQLAHWLCEQQNPEGSFANDDISGAKGLVFDTGQVLFGLRRAFIETKQSKFQTAAERAVKWLIDIQSADGAWRNFTHMDRVHVYNARSAWSAVICKDILPELSEQIEQAIARNLTWVQSRQLENGLFLDCGFKDNTAPFTHTIAYTIRGMLEGGIALKHDEFIGAARKSADALLPLIKANGFLTGKVSLGGKAKDRSVCLTGNCQMALVYFILARLSPESDYAKAANQLLDYVISTQNLTARNDGVRGGIAGSYPVWGAYTPLAYPNWAAKFFIDAMLERNMHKLSGGQNHEAKRFK